MVLYCKVTNIYVHLGKTPVMSVLIMNMLRISAGHNHGNVIPKLAYDLPSNRGIEVLPPMVWMIFTWLVADINFSSPCALRR